MQPPDLYNVPLILGVAFLLGVSVGSFVTMASYRLPLDEDIVRKPSYCPHCKTSLRIPDLFPLLSWLILRGKCRHCHVPVSARYPVIELAMGLVFAALTFFYGITAESVLLALLATELAIMIVADFEHYMIPDFTQILVLLTGIAWSVYHGRELSYMAAGIGTGLAIGLSLHFGYLRFRKINALGFGDVKFLAVVGAWIPVADFVPFLFLSGVIGTATGLAWRAYGRGAVFPFGPALAVSLFINVLFPHMLERIA